MVDRAAQFEGQDLSGTTTHFNGTVGTSAITLPATPTTVITEVLIENSLNNSPSSKKLLISFDGGVNFKTLGGPGSSFVWSPKGEIKQIQIKASAANTEYEIVMNREES